MESGGFRNRLWANFAILAAVATVLASVVRVFAWSKFDLSTSLAVLSVADRGTLLAATLIPVLIGAVPLLVPELLLSPHFSFKRMLVPVHNASFSRALANYSIPLGFIFLLVNVVSFNLLVALGGLMVLALVIWLAVIATAAVKKGRESARAIARYNLSSSHRYRAWPVFIPVAIATLFSAFLQPWSPLEYVERAPQSSLTGYVMGESSGFTLVISQRKTTTWVATESINSREICQRSDPSYWNMTLVQMFTADPLPTICPITASEG